MSDFELNHAGGRMPLEVTEATEGPSGLGVNTLLKDTGHVTLDPGFTNTASTTSAITYIDGEAGILRYRGYPIEELAEKSSFLEVAYLLIYGELPTATSSPRSPTTSATTPCSTRSSALSSRPSRGAPTRWRCCRPR